VHFTFVPSKNGTENVDVEMVLHQQKHRFNTGLRSMKVLHHWTPLYLWFSWSWATQEADACPISLARRNSFVASSLYGPKLRSTTTSYSCGQQFCFQDDDNNAPWRKHQYKLDNTVALLVAASFSSPSVRLVLGGLMAILAWQSIEKLHKSEPVRRATYFWRHAGPIVAHYKLTNNWLSLCRADQEDRDRAFEVLHDQYAQPALNIALHLRGLYVKLGQIMSSRPDFLPQQYVVAFTELQDNIPAWDTEIVQATAEQALIQKCPAFQEYEHLILDPIALG
jgi:hypothetical protein